MFEQDAMNSIKYRVFVCTKQRSANNPEGCCCNVGALEIYQAFQAEVQRRNLADRVEVRSSGCLDHCAAGAVVLVSKLNGSEPSWLPTKIQKRVLQNKHWYARLTVEDIPEIVDRHFVYGQPLERKSFYV
jgi:(2Fe-2S) ferredoxin